MTAAEMIEASEQLLAFEAESEEVGRKIQMLGDQRLRLSKSIHQLHGLLGKTVGGVINERIIPIGDQAVIVSYNEGDGASVRISNRVVRREG